MLFKQRKSRTFSYTPRFSKDNETSSSQKEISKHGDFSSKWRDHQGLSGRKFKKGLSLPLLLLVLAVALICMYILDIKSK